MALIQIKQPENTIITKLAFKQRLTQSERILLRKVARDNDVVYDFNDLIDSATYVDLSRKDTRESVKYLEQAGLLAEGRANEILNNPISPEERFNG